MKQGETIFMGMASEKARSGWSLSSAFRRLGRD